MIEITYPWNTVQRSLTVVYPWLIEQAGAKGAHATDQKRVGAGVTEGGQFSTKDLSGSNLPKPVHTATVAYLEMNRKRVALAKARGQLKKNPDSQVHQEKIKRLTTEYDEAVANFKSTQKFAAKEGYQVNALGKWTNQGGGKEKITDPHGLPDHVVKAMEQIDDDTLYRQTRVLGKIPRTIENANIVDAKTGKVIENVDGAYDDQNGHHVQFTDEQLDKSKGQIITHNHPSGSSFSDADIAVATRYGLKEIRAVGVHNDKAYRYRFSFEAPDEMSSKWLEAQRTWRNEKDNLMGEYTDKVLNGKMTGNDAWFEHSHRVNTKVADYLSRYTGTKVTYTREELP